MMRLIHFVLAIVCFGAALFYSQEIFQPHYDQRSDARHMTAWIVTVFFVLLGLHFLWRTVFRKRRVVK